MVAQFAGEIGEIYFGVGSVEHGTSGTFRTCMRHYVFLASIPRPGVEICRGAATAALLDFLGHINVGGGLR